MRSSNCCLVLVSLILALHQSHAQNFLTRLLGFDKKCQEGAKSLQTNPNVCAILYDEDDCRDESFAVNTGYTELPLSIKNDAEAIVLRQGCTLVAYEEGEGENNEGVVTFKAPLSSPLIIEDLDKDQLREDIEAVNCFCGGADGRVNAITTDGARGWATRFVSGVKDKLGFATNQATSKQIKQCNKVIELFNKQDKKTCAILFDEEDCDEDLLEVGEGYTSIDGDMDDDAESVMVRPGCVLIGYDRGRSNLFGQGKSIVIRNDEDNSRTVRLNQPLVKNLRGSAELEEDIGAVECECRGQRTWRPTEFSPKSGGGQQQSGVTSLLSGVVGGAGRTGSGNAADKKACQEAFASGDAADCILYDDEDCTVEDWPAPEFLTRGESRAYTFDFTTLGKSLKYRNTIESVSVRAGCRLEVFDDAAFGADDKGLDDQYVFQAPRSSNLHVTLDKSTNKIVRNLDDDINSARCIC